MLFSTLALALAAAKTATSAPLAKRADEINDGVILNYALTLEHLENTFYSQGLATFNKTDFENAECDDSIYDNLQRISKDEADHVAFLTAGLTAAGVAPVQPCTYNFGYTDVKSFLATASVLEGVGVSAYLGAAASILNKSYLTAAASILTVEARHSAILRDINDEVPFPQAFDTPLSFNEVYSLASQFITSCPSTNVALPLKAFPALTVALESDDTDGEINAGDDVTISSKTDIAPADGASVYAAFISVTGPTFVEATWADAGYQVTVPEGFAGQTYVVLTNNGTVASDDTILAGPAIIEIS